MLTLFIKGGPMMWALLFCSILGFYIIFYKLFYLLFNQGHFQESKKQVTQLLKSQDHLALSKKLNASSKALYKAAGQAIQISHEQPDNVTDGVRSYTLGQVSALEKHMALLSSLITITPILGLIGTVLGLMNIFQVISGGGIGDTAALSAGIAEALITTVTGLAIAVPFIVMHQFISQRIEALGLQIERMLLDMIQLCKQS